MYCIWKQLGICFCLDGYTSVLYVTDIIVCSVLLPGSYCMLYKMIYAKPNYITILYTCTLHFVCTFSDSDECISSPCQHSAKCVDKVHGYMCDCMDGYTGVLCETG